MNEGRRDVTVDPAVLAVLGEGEWRTRRRGMRPGQRRKAKRDEARSKATYDLPEWLVGRVADEAAELDCSMSGLVGLLLVKGLEALGRGEFEVDEFLRPSRSPRFGWVVEVPELEVGNGEEKGNDGS